MSFFALTERLAEAAGPIVVKEIRQGLRARVFAVCFGLLLSGCLIISLVAAAEVEGENLVDRGPRYFQLFLIALAIVEFFVIPYGAFRAMSREQEDETWVLLALTGLGPRRIVRGKVASALAQGLLYASACAPFVLFSYYLNGVDLPTVLVALAMAAAWSTLLVCLGVAIATQAHSRIGRAVAHLLMLAILFLATAAGIGWAALLAKEGGRLVSAEHGFQAACLVITFWSLSSAALLSEASASGLALVSENSARGPRLVMAVQVLSALAVGFAVAALGRDHRDVATGGSILTSLHLVVCGAFAISERDGFSRAFARSRSFFKPGAVRGFLLILALLFVCTLAWEVLNNPASSGNYHSLLLACPLYVVLYLSLGVLAGRWTPLRHLGEPLATRIGFAGVTFLGSTVPPFLAVLAQKDTNDRAINFLNPLIGVVNNGRYGPDMHNGLAILGTCALLAAFLAWATLSARDVELKS